MFHNRWYVQYPSDGSPGDAAAALATTLATASDIAGSTRIPASFSGNVGFKAPYDMILAHSVLSAERYRGDSTLARIVQDTALLSNVLTSTHPCGPSSTPARQVTMYQNTTPKLKINVSTLFGDYEIDSDLTKNTNRIDPVPAGRGTKSLRSRWRTTVVTSKRLRSPHFKAIFAPRACKVPSTSPDEWPRIRGVFE